MSVDVAIQQIPPAQVSIQQVPPVQVNLVQVGARGYSAYEVAVQQGFAGTEAEWLESLAAGGEGAMVKAVYDPDNDGIVDNAAKIEGLPINQISLNGGYF